MFTCAAKALLLATFIANSLAYSGYWNEYRSQEDSKECPAHKKERWTYNGDNGPSSWGLSYPDCYGNKQSPVDIISIEAKEDKNLFEMYLLRYDEALTKATIENNGHSVQITPHDDVVREIVVGSELYSLRQFHFHWGSTYSKGSEHTIDGVQYAMEMHFVHMNDYDDIAVVGVFLQEQDDNNPELQKIVDELENIQYKNSKAEMGSNLILEKLLPRNPTSFYRYIGSLTTPGCTEGVIWSVVPQPISVGKDQMKVFREKLYSTKEEEADDSCKLADNYRPVQPLNDRQVSRSATV